MIKVTNREAIKYCVNCKHFACNLNESPCRECLNEGNVIGRDKPSFAFDKFEKPEIKYRRRTK